MLIADTQLLARLAKAGRSPSPVVPRADLLRLLDLAGYGEGADARWLRAQATDMVETVGPRLRELVMEARGAAALQ